MSPFWESDPRTRGPQSPALSDTTVIITSVQGGAREPLSGFPDGAGWWVGGAAVGPQGSSPRTGSPAFCGADHRRGRGDSRGRGRPCDLQRQVLAVPLLWRGGAPASVHRQSGGDDITVEIPQAQFLEKVVDVPVECNVRCFVETVQKTVEVLQLALIDKVDDVPVVHVVVGVSWKVPQVQFIARVSEPSSSQRDGLAFSMGMAAVKGFWRVSPHFLRSSRLSGVERQFSEPSMMKSSSSSRAPLHN